LPGVTWTTVAGQCRNLTGFAGFEQSGGPDRATVSEPWHTSQPMTSETTQPLADDPRPGDLERATSLLLVNTGDGKGKSSAAFGVMLRGVAAGWPVAVLQFIKSGEWKVGEEKIGRQLGVEWHSLGTGFTWDSNDPEHDRRVAADAWATARELILRGDHRLVILDELTYLCSWGWIDTADVVAVLAGRPVSTSIIVTGRDCPAEIVAIADTVTEMRKIKHAYDSGITAKRGIEY
jgi:cob(I)alamin adenosyltransferase